MLPLYSVGNKILFFLTKNMSTHLKVQLKKGSTLNILVSNTDNDNNNNNDNDNDNDTELIIPDTDKMKLWLLNNELWGIKETITIYKTLISNDIDDPSKLLILTNDDIKDLSKIMGLNIYKRRLFLNAFHKFVDQKRR